MLSPFHLLTLACFVCLNCSAKPNLMILINDKEIDKYTENFSAWTLEVERALNGFFNTQLLSPDKVKDFDENLIESDRETVDFRIAHQTTSIRLISTENNDSLDFNKSKSSKTESLTIEFTEIPVEQINALSKTVLNGSDQRADNNDIKDPNIILLQNLNVNESSHEKILGSKTDFILIIERFNVDEHTIVTKTKFFEGKKLNLQASVDFTLASFATGSVIARDKVLANRSILSSLSKTSDSKSSELKILNNKLAQRFASNVFKTTKSL